MYEKYTSVVRLFDTKFTGYIKEALAEEPDEIRLRAGRKTEIVKGSSFITLPVIVSVEDIALIIKKSLKYSMFANEEHIKQGWINIEGGHRVAFCGRALRRNGTVNGMDSFSSLNIRLAKEIPGVAEDIIPYIMCRGGQVMSSLIISAPGVGKTTLLRDLARILSSGENALKISVADERGEIACCRNGMATLDIGNRCDVLDMYDKSTAINMLVRLMSPDVIITDEIGSEEDVEAICDASVCGVSIIASAHGHNVGDFFERKHMRLMLESSSFDRFIFIRRYNDRIIADKVYDRNLSEVRL